MRARRALTMAIIVASMADAPTRAYAQTGTFGQSAMQPAGGLVNQAVNGLQPLNAEGLGMFYYGVNAADRGLGYQGGYMTLGGFVPYGEDDLGGLWSADLRGHLSEYGGFFSNVGLVRKQFLGGAIGGLGIYWDHDADQNQYPVGNGCGTAQFGQFGHTYNQVGVSGEFLTDYGNLRTNGYIPVGTTAYTAGSPGSPFYQNYLMCQYGLDAALSGADLEVGAYVPGLADWAGMISVGGYALGQARYNWPTGTKAGKDVVPYFGGVYTRLDMTFRNNWDFSLQANNDSFFDWTGFARLTYRMGRSRRRNVPDQMEQPMFRNEHIVRAHQSPQVAINEANNSPWRVFVVNNANTTSGTGNGTAENPFKTLEAANAAATNPFDIVYVEQGKAVYQQTQAFSPLAQNQFLIGAGTPFCIASCCGPINIVSGTTRPTLSNPTGPSVTLDGGLTTANFIVAGSRVGVQANSKLLTGDTATVTNYSILGSGTGGTSSQPQTGIELLNTGGNVVVANALVQNMTDVGIRVNGVGLDTGNAPNLSFQGSVVNTGTAGGGTSPIVEVKNTLGGGGGEILIAVGGTPAVFTQGACPDLLTTTVPNKVSDIGGGGVVVDNSDSLVAIDNLTLTNSVGTAVSVTNSGGKVGIGLNGPATITNPGNGAILVQNSSTEFGYKGEITNSKGNAVRVDGTTGGTVAVITTGTSAETGMGLVVQNSSGDVLIEGFNVASSQQGLLVQNNTFSGTSGATFSGINITAAGVAGVQVSNNTGPQPITFDGVGISLSGTGANPPVGFLATNNEFITMTGTNSVAVTGNAAVSVTNNPLIKDTTKLLFMSISSTNSPTNGVLLSGVDGTFDVTGSGISVANSTGPGVAIQNTQTGLTVNVPGVVTVSGTSGGGISLVNVNQPGTDTVLFNTVQLTTTGGTGLLIQNATAPAAGNGLVQINGGTINSTNGPAISAVNANLAVNLTSVTSNKSGGAGINLIGNDATGGYPGLTIGTTTITSPNGNGIFLKDNQPIGQDFGAFADFGAVSITGAGQSGIFAENTNAIFSSASITGSGLHGVNLVATAGEQTYFSIDNSKISVAGGSGVNILSSGGGIVDATVHFNTIAVAGNPVTAVVGDAASTIGLDLVGNSGPAGGAPGVGKIVLNNGAGGTFNVVQTATLVPPVTIGQAISNDNNSPALDITTITGLLTGGQTIPKP